MSKIYYLTSVLWGVLAYLIIYYIPILTIFTNEYSNILNYILLFFMVILFGILKIHRIPLVFLLAILIGTNVLKLSKVYALFAFTGIIIGIYINSNLYLNLLHNTLVKASTLCIAFYLIIECIRTFILFPINIKKLNNE